MSLRSVQNFIKVFLFIAVVWMLLFGVAQIGNNPSQKCPFSGHSMAICKMNPTEHIQEWQSIFTILPASTIFLTLFALLALVFLQRLKLWNGFSISRQSFSFVKNFEPLDNLEIFYPLKEAFSQGILNPKTF